MQHDKICTSLLAIAVFLALYLIYIKYNKEQFVYPRRSMLRRRSPMRRSPMRRSPMRRSAMRRSPMRRSPMRRENFRHISPVGTENLK